MMERKLIDYLPQCIQDFQEVKAIMNAEQFYIEKVWTDSQDVMNEQFIVDATENGVKRLESILNITPKITSTLDERKFNIQAKLNEQLPYTMKSLENMMTSLCGENGYKLKLDPGNYELIVKLALFNVNNIESVSILLDKMLPANIMKNVSAFNNHKLLKEFTHEQLTAFTHKELVEAIL